MFGKEAPMNPLESRKKLLIAESDLNRAELIQEWGEMAEGVRSLAHRAKSFGIMSSATMSLVAGIAAFTSGRPAPAASKSSWFQKVASGVRLVSTIWLLFRSRGSDSGKK